MAMTEWEPVVGLEVHAHLKTRTKMFCRCALEYGGAENTHTCPVCLAHPGALPVPNARAIELTIMLGLALDCEIAERAVFARKNYFYPDLPKGYQISQYEAPLCGPGRFVAADGGRRPRDRRHRARAPRGGRGEDRARRRRDRPLGRRRLRRSSTSTAAARRCSRSSASPTCARPTRRCATSACCGRRSSSSASPTRRWRRGRCARTSTSRCGERGRGGLPAALGDQEHELVHASSGARSRPRAGSRSPRTRRGRRSSSRRTTTTPTPTGSPCTARRRRPTTTATSPSPTSCPVEPPAELVERLRGRARRSCRPTGSGGSSRGARLRARRTSSSSPATSAKAEALAAEGLDWKTAAATSR